MALPRARAAPVEAPRAFELVFGDRSQALWAIVPCVAPHALQHLQIRARPAQGPLAHVHSPSTYGLGEVGVAVSIF